MLYNVSYNRPKIDTEIRNLVGPPFGLIDKFKMGGCGSPKLHILAASTEIKELLDLDNNLNTCNIEIRTSGIIIRFRSLLETYALPIPYYKLTIYKTDAQVYSLYKDNYQVRIAANSKNVHNFISKIQSLKVDYAGEQSYY